MLGSGFGTIEERKL